MMLLQMLYLDERDDPRYIKSVACGAARTVLDDMPLLVIVCSFPAGDSRALTHQRPGGIYGPVPPLTLNTFGYLSEPPMMPYP